MRPRTRLDNVRHYLRRALTLALHSDRSTRSVRIDNTSRDQRNTGNIDDRHARPKSLSLVEEYALKPKDQFNECNTCPEMIVVPSGEFIMGSPESEEGRSDDESPQHKVSFAIPFAVGQFAVTFDEWDACVADRGCRNHYPGDRGWGRGRRPVINIWWEDADSLCAMAIAKNWEALSVAQ